MELQVFAEDGCGVEMLQRVSLMAEGPRLSTEDWVSQRDIASQCSPKKGLLSGE